MRITTILRTLLALDGLIVEKIEIYRAGLTAMISFRLVRRERLRCGICGRRCRYRNAGDGRRRWQHLDFGIFRLWLEGEAPRVTCPEHGVTVVAFPFAEHGARCTYAFEDQVAWLAVHCTKQAVCVLMRISEHTVARILVRVQARLQGQQGDRSRGLHRLGMDELTSAVRIT